MNRVVALDPKNLLFIFHCTDGDLYTYNEVVTRMETIQDAIAHSVNNDNSTDIPFDRSIVAAAIILQEIGINDSFYQMTGPLDNRTLTEIIQFYKFVGNYDPHSLYFDSVTKLIKDYVAQHIQNNILGDTLKDLEELLHLYSYYKTKSFYKFDSLNYQDKLEFLNIENDPQLRKALKDTRVSTDYQSDLVYLT